MCYGKSWPNPLKEHDVEISIPSLAIGFLLGTALSTISSWYLLRFEKEFIYSLDRKSAFWMVPVILFTPFIATWFLVKRWNEWSLG